MGWQDIGVHSGTHVDAPVHFIDGAASIKAVDLRLVGADYLSIAPFGDPTPTQVALLAAGVVILEGLDLRQVDPDAYDLICLPLLIRGPDGGPARAIVRRRPA